MNENIIGIQLPEVWKTRFKKGLASVAWMSKPPTKVRGQIRSIATRSIRSSGYIVEHEGGEEIVLYSGPRFAQIRDALAVISTDAVDVNDGKVNIGDTARWVKHPDLQTDPAWLTPAHREQVIQSWRPGIRYLSEAVHGFGLRSPQLGALHSISAHWTLGASPGIVVMPTGTGKTEVMLAVAVGSSCRCVLVIVPSDALRSQTAAKFESLGILKTFGIVPEEFEFPIVGRLHGTPKAPVDLALFDCCNVIVSTMQALAGAPQDVLQAIAGKCSHVFFDEAHHTPAESWVRLKDCFAGKPILQFTATPFRRDGKRLDGKILFNYPLARAQKENYFKPIRLKEVWQWDDDEADAEIAETAVQTLREDIAKGYNHILMARAETTDRANELFENFYARHADLNPVVVHQKISNRRRVIEAIKNRQHRIVVCVDMLGEGFDLPNLKISAIHDAHRSLGVTLQFAGRFTRTNLSDIGEATVIVNMANQRMSEDLEELYSENADWNHLLAKLSTGAIDPQIEFSEFHAEVESAAVDEPDVLSDRMLEPKTSTFVYRTKGFNSRRLKDAMPKDHEVIGSWQNKAHDVHMLVTRRRERLAWARTKAVTDEVHDLVVVFHDKSQNLLFIHSSSKANHRRVAQAVGKNVALIDEENIFRVLGKVERLMFYSAGLRGGSKSGIRFQMLSGIDVAKAIDPSQQQNTTKSNLFGVGYEEGQRISIGCSRKGTIWSMQSTSIPEWKNWCQQVGKKLLDSSIPTDVYLEHTLIPKEITSLPTDSSPLFLDWPAAFYSQLPRSPRLRDGVRTFEWIDCELSLTNWSTSSFSFKITHLEGQSYDYTATLDPREGLIVALVSPVGFTIDDGTGAIDAEKYFSSHRPVAHLPDGSLIDGNTMLQPRTKLERQIDLSNLVAKDWSSVDITVESLWKNGVQRTRSVQGMVLDLLVADPATTIVFDDDDQGEVADVVTINEVGQDIHVHLYHCKFAGSVNSGSRASDLFVVCGQAQKAVHWCFGLEKVAQKLRKRETNSKNGRDTRFHKGGLKVLDRLRRQAAKTRVTYFMTVVQPGLSKSGMRNDHSAVLGATGLFLKQHLATDLTVWTGA